MRGVPLSERWRLLLLICIYGISGGLTAVAFMSSVHIAFDFIWLRLAEQNAKVFLIGSFLALSGSSLIAGILMVRFAPDSAGSGIPQLKRAYWADFGRVSFRSVVVKFIAGVITLAGGSSLGREGPTVFMGGGIASVIAERLGLSRREQRHALRLGAAAGLAAAFNTPLAGISFVLEELLNDLRTRIIAGIALASIIGALIVYTIIGRQPSFFMPAVQISSLKMFFLIPFVAAFAGLTGVFFQKATLKLRFHMKKLNRIPSWLHPMLGAIIVWMLGCAVYFGTGRLGVFGLGYLDLSNALKDGIIWKSALLLMAAKVIASVLSYGSGGCGGIFAPTLFMGAMCGFSVSGIAATWLPLAETDHFVLAAVGMSACLGAVVRAPITSVLIIFEMTHQTAIIPELILGVLTSQITARLAGQKNFYDSILEQDGCEIHKIIPPRDLTAWRALSVSLIANTKPVALTTYDTADISEILQQYPYRFFPVIIENQLKGVVSRVGMEIAIKENVPLVLEKASVFLSHQTLKEIESEIIQSHAGLFLVKDTENSFVTGVFTLHDLLRAQNAIESQGD